MDLLSIFQYLWANTDVQACFKLVFSAVLAGLIGWDRSRKGKPVGARTCVILSTSATLFTIMSIQGFQIYSRTGTADPARLAAQILPGIGFIGAGAIFRDTSNNYIKGITTAAAMWAITAIGMAVAINQYTLATVATILIMLTLNAPKRNYRRRTQLQTQEKTKDDSESIKRITKR
ncbi:MAG: MgtC/SapB family protein [bacterium]